MGILSRLKRTLRGGDRRFEDEIQEELRFHLHMDAATGGFDDRETRLRLGNTTRIEEETRAMGIIEWLDSVMADARYGMRQLSKAPMLVSAVVLSLAVGIGANTAIFSLFDAALMRPLPVADPDSLRIVAWTNDKYPDFVSNINGDFNPTGTGRFKGSSVSANAYRSLARQQTAFETFFGIADPRGVAIAIGGAPVEQASLQYVSSNFFHGIGVNPEIGRGFADDEDGVGREPVVVVSHRLWEKVSGGDRNLDRLVKVNNVPARVVGVARDGFFGMRAGQWTDVYAPLAARVAFERREQAGEARGEDDTDWWVREMGRLKPGISETAALSQITSLLRGVVSPEKSTFEMVGAPGRRGFNALNARDSNALWILMVLVGVLLLIVCANVANLLLSRSVGRQRESAVRLALGAARIRLFRQHLIEGGLLAILGGAAGLFLGYVLAHAIHLLVQTGRDASSAFDLHLDLRVLGYTAGISILTALLFGLAPAVRAAQAELGDALKTQTRSVAGGRMRLPKMLVSIQIALSLTALMAAGLLGRSLEKLKWTDVGFDRENLAYATVDPSQAGYAPERVGAYEVRLREELSRLPGVLRVATTEVRLLSGNGNAMRVHVPGRAAKFDPSVFDPAQAAFENRVGDGFFETMGIPLLAGRSFEPRDFQLEVDAVVVDELFAQRFFPKENPLGKRFGNEAKDPRRYEIVGVVRLSRYNSLREDPLPTIYFPYVPKQMRGPLHWAIRTNVDLGRLAEVVRKAVASVDPAVPLTEFHTQNGLIDRLLRTERLLGFLSGALGIVALTLAAIGLGGLLAYAVARRTNEIGIRMALGAASGDVIGMVLRDSMWMVGAGILVGLPCAYVIGRTLKTTLFGLEPLDSWTVATSFAVLCAVAVLAAWIPARRAAGIDPMSALREE